MTRLHRCAIVLASVSACGISGAHGTECSVVATYVEHFTLETAVGTCFAMSDQTLMVDPAEPSAGSGAEGSDDGSDDGSGSVESGCADSFDPTTCTLSTTCELNTGGTSITMMTTTLVLGGPEGRGTEKLVVTSADGTSICTYAIYATAD